MTIEIKTLDTLFFRDGKPFSMGDDTWADGVFPPLLSVYSGALRTAYFGKYPKELHKANTKDDPTKDLIINKMYYKAVYENGSCEYYLPLPMDCVHYKNDEDEDIVSIIKLKQFEINNFHSNSKFKTLLKPDETKGKDVENIEGGLISIEDFKKYLNNESQKIKTKRLSYFINSEPKVGIARTINRVNKNGRLYRVDMKRLHNLSIILNFEGLQLEKTGLLKLGAEGKAVSYKSIDHNLDIESPDKLLKNESYFKMIVSTPILFKNGWLPDGIDENTLSGTLGNSSVEVELISVSLGKQIYVSGFDMKIKRPKPLKKAIPSGSVYYFKIKNKNSNLDKLKQGATLCSYDEYNKKGFGICYFGKTKIDK